MDNKKLLTIIIPIFNVEDYLEQCLDSLLNQSNLNFHVNMVNDGSTDSSGAIAKRYAANHPDMFSYYEQKNQGLGSARNHGLEETKTEYVTFLDSDDWWMPKTMEKINKAITCNDARPDLVFTCPMVYDTVTGQFSEWRDNEEVRGIFNQNGEVLCPRTVTQLYKSEASICRIVIRMDILRKNEFRFPEGIKWEDVYPHFVFLHWSQRCVLVKDAGFVYRINTPGQTTLISDRRRLDIIPAFSKIYKYAYDHKWAVIEKAYIFNTMMEFIYWFINVTNSEVYPELVQSLHKFSKKVPNECFRTYRKNIPHERKMDFLWIFIRSDLLYRIVKSQEGYQVLRRNFLRIKNRIRRK